MSAAPARTRTATPTAVVAGTVIGAVLCLLNVLVVLRTGASFGGSALVVLVAGAVLALRRQLSWPRLFVAFSLASSGYFAVAAVDSSASGAVLAGARLPPWWVLAVATAAANLLGVALGRLVAQLFRDEALPFPTLRPAIDLIALLVTRSRASAAPLLGGAAVGAGVSALGLLAGADATPTVPGLPLLGVAVSPLLLGAGLLMGHRAAGWLAVGALWSVAVWAWRGGRDGYSQHLTGGPWVLPVGVGVIVGYSLVVLVRARQPFVAAVRDVAADRRRRAASLLGGGAGLIVLAVGLSASLGLGRGLLLAASSVVLAVLFALFLCRVGAETGIAPLSPVLFLSVIVLRALGLDVVEALLAGALVTCVGMTALYYFYVVEVVARRPPDVPEPRPRVLLWTQCLGGVVGSLVGIGALVLLLASGALGGASLPAPIARTVAFLASSLGVGDSATTLLPVLAALPVGVALTFTPVMPSPLGLGVLLPPSSSVVLALGGLLAWAAHRKIPQFRQEVTLGASGLVVGEGLVTTAVLLVRALS